MADNPVFQHFLFGIYVVELGKFLRDKFKNFAVVHDGQSQPIATTAQVYFGTPRAAFRYYYERFNGMIKLPMINYHLSTIERLPHFEPTYVVFHNKDTLDRINGQIQSMRAPGVFKLTYSVNIFNNSYRERDYMLHALFTAFPKGQVHLIYFPDATNHKDVFLQMPHEIDLNIADETEIEGLDEKETRDIIKTSIAITCSRAFVPYDVTMTPAISYISFTSTMNDMIQNNITTSFYLNWLKVPILESKILMTVPDVTTNII